MKKTILKNDLKTSTLHFNEGGMVYETKHKIDGILNNNKVQANDYQPGKDLQAAIASFLARDDLTTEIKDFIALAEARMGRELDTRKQEKRATTSTVADDEYIILPTDLREIRMVKINSAPQNVLQYMTPIQLYEEYAQNAKAMPRAYTILGSEIALRPVPDSTYTIEMIYGEGLDRLGEASLSNLTTTEDKTYVSNV